MVHIKPMFPCLIASCCFNTRQRKGKKWLGFTAHRIFFLVSEAFVSILRSMGMIYALTWERHILKLIEIYKSLDLWRVTFLWERFFWSIETFMIGTRNSSYWRPASGYWWALRSSNIDFMAIWNVGGAFFGSRTPSCSPYFPLTPLRTMAQCAKWKRTVIFKCSSQLFPSLSFPWF